MASEGTGGGLKTFIFTRSLGLGLLGASLWALMFSWFVHIFFFTKYQLRELEDPGVLSRCYCFTNPTLFRRPP